MNTQSQKQRRGTIEKEDLTVPRTDPTLKFHCLLFRYGCSHRGGLDLKQENWMRRKNFVMAEARLQFDVCCLSEKRNLHR